MKVKTSLIVSLLLLFGLTVGCHSLKSPKVPVSPEMAAILVKYKGGDLGLNIEGLPESQKNEDLPLESGNGYEVHVVPPAPNYADVYSYRVVLDKTKEKYWIIRYGGIAGNTTVYGPCELVNGMPTNHP